MAAIGAPLTLVTATPFDMSTLRQQAAIKKHRASPVYRLVVYPDEKAQQLALNRAKLLAASMSMERAGLPAPEGNPFRDLKMPCGYCNFKTQCIADGENFGLYFPPIPEWMKDKPYEEVA
jgi:hypothetical protein